MHKSSTQLPALRPMEHLELPRALSGADGINRASSQIHNQLGAQTDREAVAAFLAEYKDSPATFRNYRKEVERLLLWAVLERGKALSDLDRGDFALYAAFLADPQPRERWCGPKVGRGSGRYSEAWKPFVGPLSSSAQKTALVIVNSMMNYFVQAGYLAGNPLGLIRRRGRNTDISGSRRKVLARTFDDEQWNAIVDALDAMPTNTVPERIEAERLRFMIALLHFLSLRISELASHRMGDFVRVRGVWRFYVTGKGNKEAEIPVSDVLLDALQRYRVHLGLSPWPSPDDKHPLVCSIDRLTRIGTRRISQILKHFLENVAIKLGDSHKADALCRASAHWFRHTSLTRQVDKGIPLTHVKANARHSKLDTTMLYVHTDDEDRNREIQKLGWR